MKVGVDPDLDKKNSLHGHVDFFPIIYLISHKKRQNEQNGERTQNKLNFSSDK